MRSSCAFRCVCTAANQYDVDPRDVRLTVHDQQTLGVGYVDQLVPVSSV